MHEQTPEDTHGEEHEQTGQTLEDNGDCEGFYREHHVQECCSDDAGTSIDDVTAASEFVGNVATHERACCPEEEGDGTPDANAFKVEATSFHEVAGQPACEAPEGDVKEEPDRGQEP